MALLFSVAASLSNAWRESAPPRVVAAASESSEITRTWEKPALGRAARFVRQEPNAVPQVVGLDATAGSQATRAAASLQPK